MVMVGVRGARMCDEHEGSVEDERKLWNAGRGSRVEGVCLLDISAASQRVFYVLWRVHRPLDLSRLFLMEG